MLTSEAIEGVHERLAIVIEELRAASELFTSYTQDLLNYGHRSKNPREFLDQRAERLQPIVQAYLAQAQGHQKARRSLKPLPVFPKGSRAVLEVLRTLTPKTADDR